MKKYLFIISCFLFSTASLQTTMAQPAAKAAVRILFVGNSFTSSNDLPSMIRELGKLDGVDIECTSLVNPNYSLDDHFEEGKPQEELKKGSYDFMVVQQGPSALPQSQEALLKSADKYRDLCKNTKTKLAFFMVWPSQPRLFDLDNVIMSYGNAAKNTGSLICPAGLAWKKAWAVDESLSLYSPDQLHPSIHGSLLAALTIYGALLQKNSFDFINYDKMAWNAQVTKQQFKVMALAATEALKQKPTDL